MVDIGEDTVLPASTDVLCVEVVDVDVDVDVDETVVDIGVIPIVVSTDGVPWSRMSVMPLVLSQTLSLPAKLKMRFPEVQFAS